MANSPTKYSDVRDDKVIESQSRDRSMIPERQPPNINFEACKVINPTSDKCTISEAGIGKSKLLKFPPEIMVMMLVQYFEFSHSKAPFRVPALVKALRCVPDLYHEALKLYYRRGYFPMRWASRKYIEHLSPTVFKEIRRLSIKYDSPPAFALLEISANSHHLVCLSSIHPKYGPTCLTQWSCNF
jgi:hypothetical protein